MIYQENNILGLVYFYYCPYDPKMKIGPFLSLKEASRSYWIMINNER